MRLKKYFVIATIILLAITAVLLTLMATVFAVKPTEQLARMAVENYAELEFELGDPEKSAKVVKFSPERAAAWEKQHPKEWIYVGPSYPRVVVSGYTVRDVQVNGKKATATVTYRRLARIVKGDTPDRLRLIAEKAHDETVTLNLVFDQGWRPPTWRVSYATTAWNFVFTKNQWWVLDPPPQRVSKQVLLADYEWKVKEYSSMWKQKLNDPNYDAEQKANVRASRDEATGNLRSLKSLP